MKYCSLLIFLNDVREIKLKNDLLWPIIGVGFKEPKPSVAWANKIYIDFEFSQLTRKNGEITTKTEMRRKRFEKV